MPFNGINCISILEKEKVIDYTPLNVLDNDDSVLTNEKDALKRCRIEFEMKEQASNQSFL